MTYDPSQYARAQAVQRLRDQLGLQWRMADRLSQHSFRDFLGQVVIDSSPEPRRFTDVAEGWQWEQADTVGPAVEAVSGVRKGYHGKRRFWRTLPRGHDKTSSIGRTVGWALAYAKRYFSAVVAAADREQAGLLVEFMQNESRLNPWWAKRIQFKTNKVEGQNGSNLKILAADAWGSFGLKNDLVVLDEVTHWENQDLFNTLVSGQEKKAGSVTIVITNAGVLGSWQDEARRVAMDSRWWHYFHAPGPMASWMSVERTQDTRRMLPRNVCRRVFDNEWLDPAEDCGFVTRREAEMCAERGLRGGLTLVLKGDPNVEYFAGVDYGPRRDRTVCAIGHRFDEEFIVDRMDVWEGKNFPEGTVPIALVEAWLEAAKKDYPKIAFVLDPYQMEQTYQKYQGWLNIEKFEPRGGKANFEMAQVVRSLVVNGRLAWYPGCGDLVVETQMGSARPHTLADEFAELVTKQMSYGYRFDHLSGKHDDRVVAIGMAAWRGMANLRRRQFRWSERYI